MILLTATMKTLVVLLALLAPSWAWAAAPKLGATAVSGAGTSDTNSQAYNGLTQHCGIVSLVVYQDTGTETISSITVTSESSMTLVGTPSRNPTSNWSAQVAYLADTTTAGNKTILISLSGGLLRNSYAWHYEVCGSGSGIALDGFGNTNGSTANPTVNVTTGLANSAIFAVLHNNTATPTAGSGYTGVNTAWFNYEAAEYKLNAGAANTYAANWTLAAAQWTIAAAGFKAVSAGAGTSGFRRRVPQ